MADARLLERTTKFLQPVLPRRFRGDMPVVPVVRLSGIIGFSTPLRPGLTLASVAKPLERAFAWPRARAVALLINSPGGSAVQSHLVFQRIRQLSREKERPVIAFVEDVAASGGYMIACAADEIVADPVLDRRLDRRDRRLVRLFQADREDRHRAAHLYAGHQQGDARSVPPREPGARGAAQGDPGGHPRDLHRSGQVAPRRQADARRRPNCSPANTGRPRKGIEYGLVDRIGDLRSVMRERYGDKVETPLVSAGARLVRARHAGRRHRAAARRAGLCRRSRLGAGSARDLGALRTVKRGTRCRL